MIGSWLWNAVAGFAGAVFAFTGSIVNNPVITSFERAIYGFVVAFVLMFGVRWFIGSFLGLIGSSDEDFSGSSGGSVAAVNFEAETPDELDSLRQLIRDNIIGDFSAAETSTARRDPGPASPARPVEQAPPQAESRRPDADMPPISNPVLDNFADFSSFGSMDDLFQSFDNPSPKPATPQSQHGTPPSAPAGGSNPAKADITAEDLANAIRTSFLDD